MNELDRLLIERDCEQLSYSYARYVDLGPASRVPELFTSDAVCLLAAGEMRGRDEMVAFFGRMQERQSVSRHLITNISIHVLDDHSATGIAYLALYRRDAEDTESAITPVLVGHYDDVYELTDEGWRFASRITTPAFR
ncbi:MAG TPA: nuclear transport factor 2 family protein [Acidimicrobiales bacterium]|jgi:hypothetical protein